MYLPDRGYPIGDYWHVVSKGDRICRELADRHYSRQNPGATMFCRPGFNLVLRAVGPTGYAVWVWHRPKWESGILGTMRKDKLFAIENTLFRNESGLLSSELIRHALIWLSRWPRALDVQWPDGAITGIKSNATENRRSRNHLPGHCYRVVGFEPFSHNQSNRADCWLRFRREWFDDKLAL